MRGKRVKALKSAACPNPGRKYMGTMKAFNELDKKYRAELHKADEAFMLMDHETINATHSNS